MAASSTASSAVSVKEAARARASHGRRAPMPASSDSHSPRACRMASRNSRTQPLPAARVRDHEGLRAHLEGGVGGGGGEPDLGQDGEVVEVVADVGDLLRAQALLAQDLVERRALVRRRPAARRRCRSSAARAASDSEARPERTPVLQPRALGEDDAEPVADVEALGLAAVRQEQHRPVGEHAVHVRSRTRRSARQRAASASSFISSPSSRGRGGGRRPPPRRPASTTGSDVILRSSIRARAAVASSRRRTVTGPGVMHSPAVLVEQRVAVALHLAPQVAVRDHPEQPPRGVDHGGHAQPLLRHLEEHVLHRRSGRHARGQVAGVHHVLDAHAASCRGGRPGAGPRSRRR